MNSQLETNQLNELTLMHKDTLLRLEWHKITLYLSQFAIFHHTKEILKSLSPWSMDKSADFYKNATQEMHLLFEKGLRPQLSNFNLESFEKTLQRGALISSHGLYHISTVLKLTSALQSFFKTKASEGNAYPILQELAQQLKINLSLTQQLLKSVNEEGEILETASPELALAHRNHANAKRKITENLEQILRSSVVKNAVQDATWMIKDGRYVLPVRTDRKNDVEGIARGVSQTGSTLFIEPKALALEQAALEKAQLEIQIEEHKIIKVLSEACFLIHEDILISVEILTQIDEIYARAQFASVLDAQSFNLLQQSPGENKFYFQNARHPLFILEKKPCVPNTLELSNANIWVLSGPNAGGKTVAMKTLGVLVLMAKCGLFVPCENALCLEYENIFVELGDRQNREEDLSTFSGHLKQLKKMLQLADEKTLILLDEGFVGTDPAVGVALARSVLEHFANKKATVIITTHFSSLKTLASDDSRFVNASMEFEAKNLRPTYKLLNGIPGQSYALELCERMDIPSSIISEARKYYGTEALRMESILKDLQQQKISVQEELEQQKELTLQIEIEFERIQNEQKKLTEIKDNLVENYRTKLQKRLNAYTNRLEIRERQFQKHLSSQSSLTLQAQPDILNTEQTVSPRQSSQSQLAQISLSSTKDKKVSLSSFDDLAKLKLENFSRTLQNTPAEAEKFRQPRNMNPRSLLDEAQESLVVLHKSLDHIEEDLENDFSYALKLNTEAKQKAKKLTTLLSTPPKNNKPANFWKEGMRVKTESFREVGQILKTADSKGLVECLFGVIKIKIFHSNLITIEQDAIKKPAFTPIKYPSTKKAIVKLKNKLNVEIAPVLPHAGNSIDLRGKTVDEALARLEQNLDKMWRSEIEYAVIIHGHGQGKVKEGVRKYLEGSSYELFFRPGRQGEGGDGVTVVEFAK